MKANMNTSEGTIVFELFENIAPITVNNFIQLSQGKKEWIDESGKKTFKPFYDGLIFHRVINDFMIQGGCPLGTGTGGPGYKFEDECFTNGEELTGTIDSDETAYAVWTDIIYPFAVATGGKTSSDMLNSLIEEVSKLQNGTPLMGKQIGEIIKETGTNKKLYKKIPSMGVEYGTLCMANSGPNTNGSQFFIVTKKDGCDWLNGKHTVFGKVASSMDVAHKIENCKKGAGDRPINDIVINSITIEE